MISKTCKICGESLACTTCNGAGKVPTTAEDWSRGVCCGTFQPNAHCSICGKAPELIIHNKFKRCSVCSGTGENSFHSHGVVVDTLRVKNF